jgi:transposase-like protein
MSDEETIDFQGHPFTCPYCSRETIVESCLNPILKEYATCDECGREFLIENGVPKRLPEMPPSGLSSSLPDRL